jgi:hypothetical protein
MFSLKRSVLIHPIRVIRVLKNFATCGKQKALNKNEMLRAFKYREIS